MSNKRRLIIDNDTVMEYWEVELNSEEGLDPHTLSEGSGKKAYFRCKNGHLKYKTINKEIDRNFYCRECASIAFRKPEILKYWNREKNAVIGLSPEDVGMESSKKAHFICENGHEYTRIVETEVKKHRCPKCHSLGFVYPQSFEVWSVKNKKTPYDYTYGSPSKAWFKCLRDETHPDHLQQISNKFGKNQGCPYCAGIKICETNSFGFYHPELVTMWSAKNKKTPYEYSYGNKIKVYWKCTEGLGHPDYKQEILHKHQGYGCPKCRGIKLGYRNRIPKKGNSFGDKISNVESVWSSKNKKSPYDYKPNSIDMVWFKCCENKNHPEYQCRIVKKYTRGQGCPVCSPAVTMPNKILYERYCQLKPVIEKVVYGKNKKYLLDLYIPDTNIILEFDGLFWHKNILREDIERAKELLSLGFRIVKVREKGLGSLGISSPAYVEVFTEDMNYYQYESEQTKKAITNFIKEIDLIVGFKSEIDLKKILKSVKR